MCLTGARDDLAQAGDFLLQGGDGGVQEGLQQPLIQAAQLVA